MLKLFVGYAYLCKLHWSVVELSKSQIVNPIFYDNFGSPHNSIFLGETVRKVNMEGKKSQIDRHINIEN